VIRNQRQLSVSRRKRDELLAAAFEAGESDRSLFEELADEVQHEIDEYVGVRDGTIRSFSIESMDELADGLVKARIARKWTQEELAVAIGTSKQMVQRDEAGGYEKAGLARLAEIADVLEYDLVGQLSPVGLLTTSGSTGPVSSTASDTTSVVVNLGVQFGNSTSWSSFVDVLAVEDSVHVGSSWINQSPSLLEDVFGRMTAGSSSAQLNLEPVRPERSRTR
jgi:DNA-binding XRE family transcriptional regulator